MTFSRERKRFNGDRHTWTNLDHYLTLHESCLRAFDHFIEQNSLNVLVSGPSSAQMEGRLICTGRVYLHIRETLEMNESNQVRVVRYAYQAGLIGSDERRLFRYDNAHVYTREGHQDEHHKHRFDVSTGEEIAPPLWVGHSHRPSLCDVLGELGEWWLEVGQFTNG